MQSTENTSTAVTQKEAHLNGKSSNNEAKKSHVDCLLEDDENMYSSDDESTEVAKKKAEKNKENTNIISIKSPIMLNTQSKSIPEDVVKNYINSAEATKKTQNVPSTSSNFNILNTLEDPDLVQTNTNQSAKASDANPSVNQSKEVFINGIFPYAKRFKKMDVTEISSDIYKLQKLARFTYLVPYLSSSGLDEAKKFTVSYPFFTSLEYLANETSKHNYSKSKVIAKMFSYSIRTCPLIGSVFVNCKKCNYINFTPFHLASIYQADTLTNIMKDLDKHRKNEGI